MVNRRFSITPRKKQHTHYYYYYYKRQIYPAVSEASSTGYKNHNVNTQTGA